MAAVELTLMIVSLFDRYLTLNRLLSVLYPQLTDEVELLITTTGPGETVGSKRQRLIECATGKFLCFIDDDDLVSSDYVSSILAVIRRNDTVDCIGFKGMLTCLDKRTYKVNYTLKNKGKIGKSDEGIYECGIGHLTPIRSEIAKTLKFPDKNHGEDGEYCEQAMEKCQTEVFIDKELYQYFARYNC